MFLCKYLINSFMLFILFALLQHLCWIVLWENTFEDGMKCTTTEFQKEAEDQEIGVQYIRKLGIYKTY